MKKILFTELHPLNSHVYFWENIFLTYDKPVVTARSLVYTALCTDETNWIEQTDADTIHIACHTPCALNTNPLSVDVLRFSLNVSLSPSDNNPTAHCTHTSAMSSTLQLQRHQQIPPKTAADSNKVCTDVFRHIWLQQLTRDE